MQHDLSPQRESEKDLKYNPNIDEDIWSDVLKLRKKWCLIYLFYFQKFIYSYNF